MSPGRTLGVGLPNISSALCRTRQNPFVLFLFARRSFVRRSSSMSPSPTVVSMRRLLRVRMRRLRAGDVIQLRQRARGHQ